MAALQQALLMMAGATGATGVLDAYTADLLLAVSPQRLVGGYTGAAALAAGGSVAIPFGQTTSAAIEELYNQALAGALVGSSVYQSLSVHRPTWATGGNYIQFAGTSSSNWQYLQGSPTPGGHSGMTVYTVHDKYDLVGTRVFWELSYGAAANSALYASQDIGPGTPSMGCNIYGPAPATSNYESNRYTDSTLVRRVHAGVLDRAATGITNQIKHYQNGVLQTSSSTFSTGTAPTGNFAAAAFVIGARASGPTLGSQAKFWAVAVYTVAHDAATVAAISAALATLSA